MEPLKEITIQWNKKQLQIDVEGGYTIKDLKFVIWEATNIQPSFQKFTNIDLPAFYTEEMCTLNLLQITNGFILIMEDVDESFQPSTSSKRKLEDTKSLWRKILKESKTMMQYKSTDISYEKSVPTIYIDLTNTETSPKKVEHESTKLVQNKSSTNQHDKNLPISYVDLTDTDTSSEEIDEESKQMVPYKSVNNLPEKELPIICIDLTDLEAPYKETRQEFMTVEDKSLEDPCENKFPILDTDLDDTDTSSEEMDEETKNIVEHKISEKPRGKNLLILDIEQTVFDNTLKDRVSGDRAIRPHLQAFLKSVYENYEIIIWCAELKSAIINKMDTLGIKDNNDYEILRVMDMSQLVSVRSAGKTITKVKWLNEIWQTFQQYSAKNSILCDSQEKSYWLNKGNGVEVSPYSDQNYDTDKELLDLAKYLKYICQFPDFSKVDHKIWRECI